MQLLVMIAVLILIQVLRSASFVLLQSVYEPAVMYSDFIFVIIGAALYYVFHPDKNSLGLDFSYKSKRAKMIYAVVTVIVFVLFITSLFLFSENKAQNMIITVKGVILFPVFEELVFRGYLWDKLEKSKIKEYQVYFIITLLFGLWHLGYWDVIYYNASNHFTDIHMGYIMLNKVFIGIAYGLVTGLVRMKTKNAYGSILLHALLNIFGR